MSSPGLRTEVNRIVFFSGESPIATDEQLRQRNSSRRCLSKDDLTADARRIQRRRQDYGRRAAAFANRFGVSFNFRRRGQASRAGCHSRRTPVDSGERDGEVDTASPCLGRPPRRVRSESDRRQTDRQTDRQPRTLSLQQMMLLRSFGVRPYLDQPGSLCDARAYKNFRGRGHFSDIRAGGSSIFTSN